MDNITQIIKSAKNMAPWRQQEWSQSKDQTFPPIKLLETVENQLYKAGCRGANAEANMGGKSQHTLGTQPSFWSPDLVLQIACKE